MGNWQEALEFFCKTAKMNAIDFYLVGSVTASIRGVEITPNDIDVFIDIEDFRKADDVFREFIVGPDADYSDKPGKLYRKLHICDFDFEMFTKPHETIYNRFALETICWNGHIIKSQTLDLLYRGYQKNSRDERVRVIEDYWANPVL